MNTQRILACEMEALCLMPVSGSFGSTENSGIPEPATWRPGAAEPPVIDWAAPDWGGAGPAFPCLAFGDDDEDEEIDDDEDSFDDMEDDFDDDFDDDDDDFDDDEDDFDDDEDDEDDDFDYDDDADYDDDFEE
ncbi:MAG: hypothetical protein LBO76_07915 [Treponema sp.]|nr:hypothetical protein [Treponema sp.]